MPVGITEKVNSEYQYIDLTRDNFPDIQLLDDWYDNFSYHGRFLFTGQDGHKWVSTKISNNYIDFLVEDGSWIFPDKIFVETYSEN